MTMRSHDRFSLVAKRQPMDAVGGCPRRRSRGDGSRWARIPGWLMGVHDRGEELGLRPRTTYGTGGMNRCR